MSQQQVSLELAKAYLKKSSDGANNLYDHLTRVLSHILTETPENSYEAFETYSSRLKELSKTPSCPQTIQRNDFEYTDSRQRKIEWYDALQSYLAGNASETLSTAAEVILPSLSLMRSAGVTMSEEEHFLICGSLRSLACTNTQIKQFRFWGKIIGSESDYHVIEGMVGATGGEETNRSSKSPSQELSGDYISKYTYWVTNSLVSQKWSVLPDVTIPQLQVASRIKKIVKGSLDRRIFSSPPFPWLEKNYLRAVIEIVSSETLVCPVQWKEAELASGSESGSAVEPVDSEGLRDITSWAYTRLPVVNLEEINDTKSLFEDGSSYDISRSTKVTEESAFSLKVVEATTSSGRAAWGIRTAGDHCRYGKWKKSRDAVVLRSLIWPGAVAVFQDDQLLNIYVGYGCKLHAPPFYPVLPLDVQEEPEEPEEEIGPELAEEPESEQKSSVTDEESEEENEEA